MSDLFDLPFEEDETSQSRVGSSRSSASARTRPATTGLAVAPTATARASRPPAPARRVLTVTELTVRVRDLLEAEFFEVWVEGELSNCRVWNTGHLYFTLKDARVAGARRSCSGPRCAT